MHMLSVMSDLASFGAAGLMGALWLWERRLNARRELQLDETHARIGRDEQRLSMLVDVVDRNTRSAARAAEALREQAEILRTLLKEMHHAKSC